MHRPFPARAPAALFAAFLVAFVFAAPAAAQSWPSKPLVMIVTEAAGSAPDLAARVICERLSRTLGQPVRAANRAGDDGVQAAARAAPDGYTWVFAPASVLVISPYISDLVPYSPEDDFAGVAMVGSAPLVVVANPALNVKSLPDLITLAREAPGRLAFASPGPRTLPGILGEMLRRRAAIDLMPQPHRGAQSVQDVIAGRTHFAVEGVPAIATAVQRGQLRALAVSSAKRLPELKDVPTVAEALPGFEFNAWYAVVAPAGTPAAAIQRVNIETNRALFDPEVEPRLNLLGIYPEGTPGPAQVDAFFESERAFWKKTARELKMAPE
jgi:tripartite-type tricarboxylate transporter receptor subunit TctC